jgi:hypothetical protein
MNKGRIEVKKLWGDEENLRSVLGRLGYVARALRRVDSPSPKAGYGELAGLRDYADFVNGRCGRSYRDMILRYAQDDICGSVLEEGAGIRDDNSGENVPAMGEILP